MTILPIARKKNFLFFTRKTDTTRKLSQLSLEIEYGIEGPSGGLLKENLYPDFTTWHDYFQCLGIFFPSTVGVLVGFNIAADLRDPHRSIPKGTFAALFTR